MSAIRVPNCVGIIPDGNRRWARKKGWTYNAAYKEGGLRFLQVVGWAQRRGVAHLVTFASTANNLKKRPEQEVQFMHRWALFVCEACRYTVAPGTTVRLFGNLEIINDDLLGQQIRELDKQTRESTSSDPKLTVWIGFACDPHITEPVPSIDLVIRAGGRCRLSGFLPQQTSQAELKFLLSLWPDFSLKDWQECLRWYAQQKRTLGE